MFSRDEVNWRKEGEFSSYESHWTKDTGFYATPWAFWNHLHFGLICICIGFLTHILLHSALQNSSCIVCVHHILKLHPGMYANIITNNTQASDSLRMLCTCWDGGTEWWRMRSPAFLSAKWFLLYTFVILYEFSISLSYSFLDLKMVEL